jgi:aminoglycoside phosphotransferase (APT) family kinase protein
VSDSREENTELARSLGRWLDTRLPGRGPLRLAPLAKPGSGLSAGTFFVEAFRSGGGVDVAHRLVVRIPPTDGDGVFPWSDLRRELEFHDLLDRARIPVAPVIGLEESSEVIGHPFVVTRRVDGRLVDSNDPYLSRGWLHDETPDRQKCLITSFFESLADIHRIDARLGTGAPDLGGALAAVERWTSYLEWAGVDAAPPNLRSALEWCSENVPDDDAAPSLLWGDAQLANAVFADDCSVAALLDFELCSVGPAELDLGWFLSLHDMTVARCRTDLPGFSDRDELLCRYEARLGRPLADLRWFEIFAAVCTASILVRMSVVLSAGGTDLSWLAHSNPALDYLSERLA